MGCGEFLVKTILFTSNLIFSLAGLILLGLGIYVQLQSSNVVIIADMNIQVAPIITMVVGGIVFLISFFGCCGAIRESSCMLITYSVFMVVLMLMKIALATLIFLNLETLLNEVPVWLNTTFANDPATFQQLEQSFKCCGTTGPGAYNSTLSATCCAVAPCTADNAYHGCNLLIDTFFNTFGLIVGCVVVVIAAIELVSAVFAICLSNHVENKMRRGRY